MIASRTVGLLAACLTFAAGVMAQPGFDWRSLAERAVRQAVGSAVGGMRSPVLIVLADSVSAGDQAQALIGGASEALLSHGFEPILRPPADNAGTELRLMATVDANGKRALEVRVERRGDGAILYSRVISDAGGGDVGEGWLTTTVVPIVLAVSAALVVYLFFAVRS